MIGLYHVVLISENRILLKKIYEMLEDPSLFRIHLVPFSMDAIEAFSHTHADIVIMDTSLFLPFEHILEQMYLYNWPFHVLLIHHEASLDYPKKENEFLLNEITLSRELFNEIIDHIRQHSSTLKNLHTSITFTWDGTHSVLIHPDSYHILVIRTFGEHHPLDAASCSALTANTRAFCNLHLIHTSGSIAVFYINRSQIKREFHITPLSALIFQTLGQKTALFYKENIPWKRFQFDLEEMVDAMGLLYFLQGESKSLHALQQPVISPTRTDLKKQLLLLVNELLDGGTESAKHILQDLYIHTIKASYDNAVLEYVRNQLQILFYLFFKESIGFLLFTCIENELAWLLESKLFVPAAYTSPQQQETVKASLLTIYKEYHTTVSLDGIAGKLGLNKIYLNRLFKNQFNLTVAETLHILRMQEAKHLLLFTDEKVYNIASYVGFSDTGYFIKAFRKTTGYSALEFRLLRENKEDFKNKYASLMEI